MTLGRNLRRFRSGGAELLQPWGVKVRLTLPGLEGSVLTAWGGYSRNGRTWIVRAALF